MGCGCSSCTNASLGQLVRPSRAERRRRRGMGDLFSDLAAQSTDFQSAWGTVNAQLTTEGASQLDVLAAKESLANAFNEIVSNPQGFGLSSADALKAATDFTIAGRTVVGAVDHVQGLLAAAQGSDPTQAFQMFTGTLIGGAAAAGAFSAGIGSVIVIGVGAALSLMQSAGLFGSPPQGQQICAGLYINPPPTIVVGCVGSNGTAVKNGSPFWRSYPKRSGGNTNDAQWFSNATSISWSGSPSGPMNDWSGYNDRRLIDSAFPDAHYLACQSVPSALASFNAAFLSAWTANKEYALNGLVPQPDWQVLRHLVQVWNRAHASSSTYDLRFTARPALDHPTFDMNGKVVGPCPANLPPFVATIVNDVLANASASDPFIVGSAIRINTGPTVSPPKRVVTLKIPARSLAASAPSSASTPWTASPAAPGSPATAVAVVGVAAAAAAAFYVWRQKKRRKPVVPPKLRARAQRLRRALHV